MATTTQPEAGEAEAAVPPGTVLLGKYRVDAVLGRGGMGVVAAATHLALGEKVAIKLLRPGVIADDEARRRFLREAQAAGKLKGEHVARVSDVGTLDDGSPYMVMEFLEGVDLAEMLAQSGVVAPPLAVDFVVQACEALGEAHALGIVHRDIKPSNFFVTWGADGQALVKILDFGISKAPVGIDLALTRTQSVLGTPAYMSPEQMRSARHVDGRTDLWSLGTVLYELIEGRRPFEAESFSEMCVKVAADPAEPMRVEVPAALAAAIFRCLEKDPARRFQTVAELAEALAPFARDPREATLRAERVRRMIHRPRTRNEEASAALPARAGVPLAQASALRAAAHASGKTPRPELDSAISAASSLTDVTAVEEARPAAPELARGAAAAGELDLPPRRRWAVIAGVAGAVAAAVIAFVAVSARRGGGPPPPADPPLAAPAAAPEPEPGPELMPAGAPEPEAVAAEPAAEPAPEAVAAEPAADDVAAEPAPRPTRAKPGKPKPKPRPRPRRGSGRGGDDVFDSRK